MTHSDWQSDVAAAEERLRLAMLHSDVAALDELLAPELIFTSHLGQLITKADDLAFHRSGAFTFVELSASEQTIHLYSDFAVVAVRVHLRGTQGTLPVDCHLRYTRVWRSDATSTVRVVAGHACLVA